MQKHQLNKQHDIYFRQFEYMCYNRYQVVRIHQTAGKYPKVSPTRIHFSFLLVFNSICITLVIGLLIAVRIVRSCSARLKDSGFSTRKVARLSVPCISRSAFCVNNILF